MTAMRVPARTLPNADTIALRRLDNGILLAAYENFASPSVILRALIQVGSMDEPPEQGGLASLTATMLARGTVSMDYDALNDAIEGVGASVGLSGRTHTTAGFAKCLNEDFPTIAGLLIEMIRRPTFPADHFERVQKQRITGLRERDANSRAMAELLFYRTAYPEGHPYHHPSSGSVESVAAITPAALEAFHGAAYGPDGAIFVVVGAIPREEALDRLEALVGDWPSRGIESAARAAPEVALPPQTIERQVTLQDKTQSDLVYGLPTIPRNHPDFTRLQVANLVLGVFGMMGRVGRSVRDDHGMAYYARTSVDATLGPSAWIAVAGVAPDAVEKAVSLIRTEWLRLQQELVPPEELADSLNYLSASLPLRLETNGGIAHTLLDILYYDLGLDYLEEYSARVHGVSAEQVREVTRRYFDPARTILAVAGPAPDGV